MPRANIDRFFSHVKITVDELCSIGQITWEVNTWYMIEIYKEKEIIQWYKADHNDSIINNVSLDL